MFIFFFFTHFLGKKNTSMTLIKTTEISMKSNWIETPGASAHNRAKLCTDRPAALEEVTRVVNMTS